MSNYGDGKEIKIDLMQENSYENSSLNSRPYLPYVHRGDNYFWWETHDCVLEKYLMPDKNITSAITKFHLYMNALGYENSAQEKPHCFRAADSEGWSGTWELPKILWLF